MTPDTADIAASCPWGWVRADGTVYLRTADGERAVGSWQAGPAADGLAHYRRRFDDLATEVDLLDRRIDSGAADPRATAATVERLRGSLATAAVVGDIDAVARRLELVGGKAQQRLTEVREKRAEQARAALARKTELVAEAETLAETGTSWKAAGERLAEIAAGWSTSRQRDRSGEAELWKRLTAARATFTRRRGAHFAQLSVERKEAQARKEQLVADAHSLADSTEWGPTARRFSELMAQWRTVPRAAREVEERLWKQFREAQDQFFRRRSEAFAARDAAGRDILAAKERVVAEVETLDLADPAAAVQRLRDLQGRYDAAGVAPREAAAALDARMRAAEQRVQVTADGARRRTAPPVNPLLEQMREQVGKAEAKVARARAAGDSSALAAAEAALAGRREFLAQAERAVR